MHSKNHFATCFKYRANVRTGNSCRFGMPRELVPFSKIDDVVASVQTTTFHGFSKSLALTYYITNYATKDDVSPWQMVAKAALLRQAIDKGRIADPPTATDLRLRERGMDNFGLRCFNSLAHDREVSGVQVASTLLHLPSYYILNSKFIRVNLWWLRRYVRAFQPPEAATAFHPHDTVPDEPCTFRTGDTVSVSMFNNYKWRGVRLASFSFFEYCMLVQIRSKQGTLPDNFEFDPSHPKCSTSVERVARSKSQIATVIFNGQLTQFQTAEDSVPGGYPTTDAILNDLSEIFLGLFVPWEKLPDLFRRHAALSNIYSHVWALVKPTLAPHNQEFAANIELFRKSKEDCQVDAILRQSEHRHAEVLDRYVDQLDQADLGSDNLEPRLFRRFKAHTDMADFRRAPISAQMDLVPKGSSVRLHDFDLDGEDGVLQPVLTDNVISNGTPTLLAQLGNNPTPESLIAKVTENIPLNSKQHLVVRRLLSDVLSWADYPYDSSRRDQLLLCITGEGGTGKTQIPKAIEAALDVLGRKHELMLTAPTGAAADNLGVTARVRKLWARKTILVIDEMSMIDLKMLSVINDQCKAARSLPRSSPDLFGGLPVVILIGDFFQFPPVRGPPLWKNPRYGNDEDAAGRLIWHRFQNVIILDEQMRQLENPSFCDFLARTRRAALTEDDAIRLNSRVIHSLTDPVSEDATVVVELNALRHPVNRIRIEDFARKRSQRIYLFAAIHSRTKSTGPTNLRLQAHDLLLPRSRDGEGKMPEMWRN
ncbi:uncharacterized protein N7515_001534 [Penicillium bovifimosum]|uniref:ATP-dependent DNA helicase n=1 Tax=Penicillium bovifimosum TaxID=126998 RepID=A0A9W9H9V4_9EURO|nr:uncharacterized protein N7515_001534 [Penicillium bovifimosum]KAJ5142747.1 hypothetical protein N7515_001534 [Penicillium bovifimosum]